MPIFMDRHDLPGVTLADAAEAHKKDLVYQEEYSCKAMTYWVDEARENAFCLIEAPHKQAVIDLHNRAHGLIPHQIIEVNNKLVNAFLGRIHDPRANDTAIDSAFRIIMVIQSSDYLSRIDHQQFDLFSQRLHNSIGKAVEKYNGKVVLLKSNSYLVSFTNVDDAVRCALSIKRKAKYVTPAFDPAYKRLRIGVSSGLPVTEKKQLFEDAQNLATQFCEIVSGDIVISSEIRHLYNKAHTHAKLDTETIRILTPREEEFLKKLMHYVELHWNDAQFNVTDFSRKMGYSKSQLNRNIKALTGYSPNSFMKRLRLRRALKLLYNQRGNISEVAFESGFNTPAYFSKCFNEAFGLLPSAYLQLQKT